MNINLIRLPKFSVAIGWLICVTCFCLCYSVTIAQEFFTLKAPGAATESSARINAQELIVRDDSGQTTLYSRLRRYDTPDGQFIGYGSRQAQRVILWPTSNRGNMRIGTLRNGQIEFAPSRMAVFALDPANAGQFPQVPQGSDWNPNDSNSEDISKTVLLSAGDAGNRLFVRANRQGQLQLVPNAPNGAHDDDAQGAWMITPVGGDMVRIQQSVGNQWLALSADGQQAGNFGNGVLAQRNQRSAVRLIGINNSIAQCWRLQQFNGGYCFESVMMPGFGMILFPGLTECVHAHAELHGCFHLRQIFFAVECLH